MRLHFGLKRAKEEICRLNIEIRRQITYMAEEYTLYEEVIKMLRSENPHLAAYIRMEAKYQYAVFAHVYRYIYKASQLDGFSGTLIPGTRSGKIRDGVTVP
jgi:hypothetical protein